MTITTNERADRVRARKQQAEFRRQRIEFEMKRLQLRPWEWWDTPSYVVDQRAPPEWYNEPAKAHWHRMKAMCKELLAADADYFRKPAAVDVGSSADPASSDVGWRQVAEGRSDVERLQTDGNRCLA